MKSGAIVARNSFWLIIQPVAMSALSIVVTAMVARHLGAAQYGLLLLLVSYVALFAPMTNLGLRPYMVREIAANRGRAVEILEDMLVLRFGLALLAVIIAAGYLSLSRQEFSFILIMIVFVLIILNALAGCFIDALYGVENMKSVAGTMAAAGVVVQLTSLVAVLLQSTLAGFALAYALGSATLLATSWYIFSRRIGQFKLRAPRFGHFKHINNSWSFFFQNLVSTIRQRIDVILINSFLGAHAAGIYGSAYMLIERLGLVQDGIATALFPRASDLHGKSTDELRTLVRGVFKIILLISTPIMVGLFSVSDDIIHLLFGSQYRDSAATLVILGTGLPFMFMYNVMFNVLGAMRLQQKVLQITIVGSVLSVAYLVAGIKFAGVNGAAAAFAVTAVTLTIPSVWIYWRRVGSPVYWRDLAGLAIANLIMGAALWLLRDTHLAVKIVLAAIVFGVTVLALKVISLNLLRTVIAKRTVVS